MTAVSCRRRGSAPTPPSSPRTGRSSPVTLDTWRGLLFAAVDPQESLLDQLGELPGRARRRTAGDLRGARTARPSASMRTGRPIPTTSSRATTSPAPIPSFYRRDPTSTTSRPRAQRGFVRMTAPPRDGLFYRGKWLWMWPNWTLSLFEGGMNTSRINPARRSTAPTSTTPSTSPTPRPRGAPARDRSRDGTLAVVAEDMDDLRTHAEATTPPAPTRPARSRRATKRACTTSRPALPRRSHPDRRPCGQPSIASPGKVSSSQ